MRLRDYGFSVYRIRNSKLFPIPFSTLFTNSKTTWRERMAHQILKFLGKLPLQTYGLFDIFYEGRLVIRVREYSQANTTVISYVSNYTNLNYTVAKYKFPNYYSMIMSGLNTWIGEADKYYGSLIEHHLIPLKAAFEKAASRKTQ